MKTRKLTLTIATIFIAALIFAFASCVETVDESVVSDTTNTEVTDTTVENAEAAGSEAEVTEGAAETEMPEAIDAAEIEEAQPVQAE